MFNLIVSGNIRERRGAMSAGRVFEYTEEYLLETYKPAGILNVQDLTQLPTILMDEGVGEEEVTIGWLTRVELQSGEYRFWFHVDPDVPKMTNAELNEIAAELGIDHFEFHRNHWAIKEADLFQVLFKQHIVRPPRPSVFELSDRPVNQNLVSLMMPFSPAFNGVYDALRRPLEADGFTCTRADDFWMHAHIIQDIIELICTSSIVVCDLSEKNANVFYETGIAHTLGKDVILIAQSMDDIPFDLRALRCIIYVNDRRGLERLSEDVLARTRDLTSRPRS